MVGPKGRHGVRRAVVDPDPNASLERNANAHGDARCDRVAHGDRDARLERNRDAHSIAHCDRDAHLERDAHCDGIYADNGDTDFDAGRNR